MALFTLDNELPELTQAIGQLGELARVEGIAFTTADYGGVRTQADTAKVLKYKQQDYDAYAARERKAGRTPLPITGNWDSDGTPRRINAFGSSWHNYGAARDLRPTKWPKGKSAAWALQRLAEIARANPRLGLRPGRYFSTPDYPHFELAITLDEAKRRYAAANAAGRSQSPDWLVIAGVAVILGGLAFLAWRKKKNAA